MSGNEEDLRAELAHVAASLRAYVEWQKDSGSAGFPRAKRGATRQQAGASGPEAGGASGGAGRGTATATVTATATGGGASSMGSATSTSAATSTPAATATSTSSPASAPWPALTIARLPVLAHEIAACQKCGLGATRTNTVFSRGNPEAKLAFVGEAPGADEDAQGLPFVGRAGQLLDKMIGAMGLDPEKDVYVCNIIKCRPPENRRPTPEEIETCIPYLHEQLAIIKPRVIVAMGNTAVSALLNTKMGITKIRGQWKLYKGTTLVMPTYHPSYLLRPSAQQAEAKRQAWEDLQAVMKEMGLALPKKS